MDAQAAAQLLQAAGLASEGEQIELLSPQRMRLTLNREELLAVQRCLSSHDQLILQLGREEESLEEAFLKLTQGSRIE